MITAVSGWQFESGPVERRRHNRLYNEFVEDASLAEALGFGAIFTSEHHFWSDGSCPNPLLPLASVARTTDSICLGTAVLLHLLHDPVRTAEQVATLHALSHGRAMLGLGMGYRDDEFDAFGVSRRSRGRLFEESLGLFKAALAESRVETHLGTSLPIFLGGHADVTLARAARVGCGLLLPPVLAPEDVRARVDSFRRHEEAAGRPAGSLPVAVHATVFVDETDDAADAFFRPRIERIYRETYAAWGRFTDSDGRPIQADRPELLREAIRNVTARVVCGSPGTVRDRLAWTLEVGADILICKVQAGSLPQDRLHGSMTLLAREVIPQLTTELVEAHS